jgi:tetratricopeptide (TPR) repeat protein
LETLAERIGERFRLLTDGNRAALPRHRTLQAMIAWSYDLLSESERVLLRRLSVFAGGWTLDAAENVGAGEPIEAENVLDLLTRLVDKSLVVYERGEARYRLLETIRQFAQERLVESGEAEAFRWRHAEQYLWLAEEAEPRLFTPDSRAWLDRLEREQDNLRALLGWVVEAAASPWGDKAVDHGLRLGWALRLYWQTRGSVTEGREWLERLLTPGVNPGRSAAVRRTEVRARALSAAGTLAWMQGDTNTAKRNYQECLSIGRELGDRGVIAVALQGLGTAAFYEGAYQESRTLHEQSLSIRRELGDQLGIALCCNNLGVITREQRDYERAQALLEESLAIRRELGADLHASAPLMVLGTVRMLRGDCVQAIASYEESLAVSQELGAQLKIGEVFRYLGTVARLEGDLETSRARYVESTRLHLRLGHRFELAMCLAGLASTVVAIGEQAGRSNREKESFRGMAWLARGTRLFGAAEALCEANKWHILAPDRIDRDRWMAVARAGLGEAAFAAMWAEGRALSLEQACALALEGDEP